jgi:hypothetical protein
MSARGGHGLNMHQRRPAAADLDFCCDEFVPAACRSDHAAADQRLRRSHLLNLEWIEEGMGGGHEKTFACREGVLPRRRGKDVGVGPPFSIVSSRSPLPSAPTVRG